MTIGMMRGGRFEIACEKLRLKVTKDAFQLLRLCLLLIAFGDLPRYTVLCSREFVEFGAGEWVHTSAS